MQRMSDPGETTQRAERGIVLAIVLITIFALITAVFTFQRRAIIGASIAQNRLHAAEADAIARGGLRVAEAIVFLIRLKERSESTDAGGAGEDQGIPNMNDGLAPSGELWAKLADRPLSLEGERTLRLSIEDEGARLNLNALVPQTGFSEDDEEDDARTSLEDHDEAQTYLEEVLAYIVDGMDETDGGGPYDEKAIAENIIDYMDADDTGRNGGDEDAYYRDQDPPYRSRNGPFLSFEEIGLVRGVDPALLAEMRHYLTIHPIGGTQGINLNRAEPWVLSLVYAGGSGDRELLREPMVRDIWSVRQGGKILCDSPDSDSMRCVTPNEVGSGDLANGSIFPEVALPAEALVFRVVAEATVGNVTRTMEAVIDTRPTEGPQLLSWRRLRGGE
ncbi:MAG: hypothetical protein CL908_26505 [Deltaproteobacteria bacterium]|nr:hypothetical protein [Deltaproteobacteria bacterium]